MVVPRPRWRHVLEPPAFLSDTAVQILKASIASGLAWEVGVLLGQPKPYFAVLAVVITMAGNTYGSLLRGGQYLLGVLVGLGLGVVAQSLVGLSAPVVAVMILLALAIGTRVKVGRDSNVQIAISALLMLAIGVVNWGVTRLWETAVGGGIAVLVAAFVWPPNPVRRVREGIARRRRQLGDDALRATELVDAPVRGKAAAAHLGRVRRRIEDADEGIAEISAADEALRWNPLHAHRRQELEALEGRARLIAALYQHVRTMVRYISDSIARSDAEPPGWARARPSLVEAVTATCDALDLVLRDADAGPALDRARQARHAFADQTEGDTLAAGIVLELGHMIGDLSAGSPEPEMPPRWWRRMLHRFRRPGLA
jgi:uncharacterized membrane protein YgaE (UPF0421/DUF939 family)